MDLIRRYLLSTGTITPPSHTFYISGPSDYVGRNFILTAYFDGNPVYATWSITSGSYYVSVNENGCVSINPGVIQQNIVVQAVYNQYTANIPIEVSYDNQLIINCADTITGTSGSAIATYNNNACVPVWSITSGNAATINEYGEITITDSGDITIQAVYNGYTTTKTITVIYQANTTTETTVDPETGEITTTTTETIVDPETGTTTETSTSTTIDPETGASSSTTSETTTNQDGSSTTNSTTTNNNGTSSETQSNTSAPDPETGSVTTNTTTTNYDENGNTTSSQEQEHVENTDGSSTTSTTNYDAEGDPTDTTNNEVDTNGNSSTQNIEYDENGDPTVTGYDIDTSGSSSGEKTFNGDGVDTEFKAFDVTDGFILHIHFTIDFAHQPAGQDENHHNVLTMKRPNPSPWYGFQLRQSGTNKYVQLGTQFATGSNTNTTINPSRWIVTNQIAEYDIQIIYDPLASTNKFVATDLITGTTIFSSNNSFPNIVELEYLSVCIGCAQDTNGDPFRYSNIDVSEFSLQKLSKTLVEPTITCDGSHITLACETPHASIYYKLNHGSSYTLYSSPITINADTFIEAYSVLNNNQSSIVSMTCEYLEPISDPIVYCDGEEISITCETPSVDIYYRLNQSGNYLLYESPIAIYADTVIETYAELDGRQSNTITENCRYNPSTLVDPTISCDGKFITIICPTSGSSIFYQLDGTGGFIQYSTPIQINADTVCEAYSELGGTMSNIVTETCIYDPTHDYSLDYLTFRILSPGDIVWKAIGSLTKTIEYSINDGAWISITSTGSGTIISVNQDDVVRFRGTNTTYATSKSAYSGFDGSSASFNVEGNIHSLLYGDNFIGNDNLTNSTYQFCSMFKLSSVISAENLILPATTLKNYCYRAMFSNAYSLTTAPALPATTLSQGCYYYMFENCAFTDAPELPATTVPNEAYYYMFIGCSNLNYIKCLATTLAQTKSTEGWVKNVASSGTFVKDGTMSSWTTGVNGIPVNWVVQNDVLLVNPVISYDGFNEVTITCATQGATIYYNVNRLRSYSVYTRPFTIDNDTYVEAYATLNGNTSTVITENCVYVSDVPLEASNRDLLYWKYNGNNITLPYCVNRIDGHSSNYSKGTFNFETNFALRSAQPTYLWFQHADQSADIYVDDVLIGTHWGGYNAFFFDISNYVHSGTNRIKVALNNTTRNTLAPAAGDFNFNATLGNVKLFTSPCLPAMNYGYDGFHITSTVSSASATIYVRTLIPSGASAIVLIDDGTYTWSDTQNSIGNELVFSTTINNPHLWHGTIDPHLYTITMEIYKDGNLYHRYQRDYGLRYYSYVINDSNIYPGQTYTGFLLNGQPYLLRGVCMHDDKDGKGNALNSADYAEEFALIQELGCNFLRLAHYPHPKEVYDWCDQLGIIVQTEVPCVNKLQSTMPADYYTHLNGQYTDMVNQHYNHPSIMFWGLSNETTTDDKEFGKTKIESYTTLIKNLDSERLVGYVMSHSTSNPSSYYNNPNVDWFGCNIYVGWYIDKASNDPTSQLNTRITNIITNLSKALAFSEYGAGGTQQCHSEDPQTTTTKGNYERHDIEYQMWLHEGHIASIRNFPQLLFTAEWQLFDIAVSNRNEGYTICLDGETTSTNDNLRRLNNKGLVERDHVTKKDTFYIYKAEWSNEKFVHICGKDYTKMNDRVIKCYSNDADNTGELVLYINGTEMERTPLSYNIATFTPRNFDPGDVIEVAGDRTSDTMTFNS